MSAPPHRRAGLELRAFRGGSWDGTVRYLHPNGSRAERKSKADPGGPPEVYTCTDRIEEVPVRERYRHEVRYPIRAARVMELSE